ncbi:tetratricopeptide repeat protein [Streptomyces lunaelactis]|uniref:tetratricopeptide repeat protein n=1 Tax=Streptomyces lunaelactis TaxID=1535768 RepID=UPI0015D3E927|nr:tetratricopeptide repeat protein [Streptomyces lunaelactis]
MKSELVKNAAISTLVGATLVTGVITLAPGWGDESPPPAPGPAARAAAAVGAGAPASLADLTALIGDREMWLRTHPRDEESWAVLGSAYVEQGTRLADAAYYRRAESALRRSLELFPGEQGNVDALVGLAALANARGDYAAARTSAESARKQRPQRWTAYPALIDACNGLGDYAAAGKAMDKLQELHEDAQTMGRAAQILRDKGWREDAAAMAYNAAATADAPAEKAAALYRLGELAWERGEPVEATGHYDAALRFAPDHHPSLAARGRALAALGRTDEAFRDYQAVLTQAALPGYALEAGELYASMGLDGDAATQYERLRAPAGRGWWVRPWLRPGGAGPLRGGPRRPGGGGAAAEGRVGQEAPEHVRRGRAGLGAVPGGEAEGGAAVREEGDGSGAAECAVRVPPGRDRAVPGAVRPGPPAPRGGAADQPVLLTAAGSGGAGDSGGAGGTGGGRAERGDGDGERWRGRLWG